jgi:hypothetical protein
MLLRAKGTALLSILLITMLPAMVLGFLLLGFLLDWQMDQVIYSPDFIMPILGIVSAFVLSIQFAVVLAFIQNYELSSAGETPIRETFKFALRKYPNMFLASLVLAAVSTPLLFIPLLGWGLGLVLIALLPAVVMFERVNIFKAIARATRFSFQNFWHLLGVQIFIAMLIVLLNFGFNSLLYQVIPNFVLPVVVDMSSKWMVGILLVGGISATVAFGMLTASIYIVANAFSYFNALEKAEGYSLYRKIESIGRNRQLNELR